jgi:Icc-related predicted phosphoesterase
MKSIKLKIIKFLKGEFRYFGVNVFLIACLILAIVGALFFWHGFSKQEFFFQKDWNFKNHPLSTLKINIINDLHSVAVQKRGEELRLMKDYQRRLDDFSKESSKFAPDFVVANGDMIDGTRQTSEIALKELGFVKEFTDNNLESKIFWTIGNHELRAINREQWKNALGVEQLDNVVESGEYKLIFLDSAYGTGGKGNDLEGVGSGALLSDAQLKWLETQLGNSRKIKLVFMHFPPLIGDDVKVGYFPLGVEKLQKLFAKYSVTAVFSGHVENTLKKNIEGVDYFVLPGISKNSVYENVFTRVRMIDDKAVVTLIYKSEDGEYVSKRVE